MENLTPIPIRAGHRWREFRIRYIPALTFLIALVSVVFIWRDHVAAPSYVGEVETVRANVISTVPGLLVELNVDRFDAVTKGQVIGKVYPADPELLKASLAAIEIELRMLQNRVALDEERNDLNNEQARLDWLSYRVELATAKVELQYAESEFRRQASLHQEKLVSDSLFEMAKNLYEARQEEVTEKAKVVAEMEKRLQLMNEAEKSRGGRTNSSLTEAIAGQEAQLLLAEGPITLTSPIDGIISSINHRAGERVMDGLPIVTITSSQANRIFAFARQPLQVIPKVGDRVQVRTRANPRKTAIGNVLHVSSGVEMMVAPLNSNGKDGLVELNSVLGNSIERGLPFSVSMPEGLTVYPGEAVDLLIVR